jgi:hypothetical protein
MKMAPQNLPTHALPFHSVPSLYQASPIHETYQATATRSTCSSALQPCLQVILSQQCNRPWCRYWARCRVGPHQPLGRCPTRLDPRACLCDFLRRWAVGQALVVHPNRRRFSLIGRFTFDWHFATFAFVRFDFHLPTIASNLLVKKTGERQNDPRL